MHLAFSVALATILIIFVGGAVRATPSIIIAALELEFGWTRALISGAVSLSLLLYGLMGPFAASFMRLYSLQCTVVAALLCLAAGTALTRAMALPVHLYLLWGVVVGAGSGIVAPVLGKVVANRWFAKGAGLVMGLFSASAQTGQVVLAPALGALTERWGWRSAAAAMAAVALAAVAPALLLLRDSPQGCGVAAYGAVADPPLSAAEEGGAVDAPAPLPQPPPAPPPPSALAAIFLAPVAELCALVYERDFLLLALSFFVCGASTNGLIGVHLVPACVDEGMSETASAGFLAVIGVFDIFGTIASGWLSDRVSSRLLLCIFYFLRGAALLLLPLALRAGPAGLYPFAVIYGLDWVSTVPPTAALCTLCFGKERSAVAFGWVLCAHQVGAAAASAGAGVARTLLASYTQVFYASGALCICTAGLVLLIGGGKGAREAEGEGERGSLVLVTPPQAKD